MATSEISWSREQDALTRTVARKAEEKGAESACSFFFVMPRPMLVERMLLVVNDDLHPS